MAKQIAAPCGVDAIVKAPAISRKLGQEHAHIWSLYNVLVNEQRARLMFSPRRFLLFSPATNETHQQEDSSVNVEGQLNRF